MKYLNKSMLLLLMYLGVAHAEVIWPEKTDDKMIGKIGVLTENHSKNILGVLESMPWIEEGIQKGEGKYMYVLYTPTSTASQELYSKTRPYLDQVNIRWIPIIHGENSVDGLYETRTPVALANAFQSNIIPDIKDQEYVNLLSSMTFTGFVYLRAGTFFSPEAKSYFPTVIYGDANKLSIDIAPNNVEDVIGNIPVTSQRIAKPSIAELAKKKFKLYNVEKNARYVNQSDDFVPYFLYPSQDGIGLGAFSVDDPSNLISGITDNGYIALDLSGRGNYIYVKYIKDEEVALQPNK
ncbi:hypothetical protein [Wohlfahrtiimonas populi]|uniref:hypothetical protein n=1 Tax=Wohlfahrtiimonas populi TaxID=1940240 RepID=UPI00098D5868|nr:hypothetical protein [Wohlfahrtiimonas populi]